MPHVNVGGNGAPTVQLVDVLERVLTKGIVVVCDGDVSLVGLHVIGFEGHATVMSLETMSLETFARATEPPPASETESSEALMTAVDEYLRRLPTGNIADTP